MARYPTIAAAMAPGMAPVIADIPPLAANASLAFNNAVQAIMGIDSKKAKRVASFRPKPANIPAVIVAPDLEIPGKIAIAWAAPIQRAFNGVISFVSLLFLAK
jgi:hypothetical protein